MGNMSEALILMVFGMGGVLLFLCLLVFLMTQVSKIFVKYSHLLPDLEPKKAPAKSGSGGSDDELVAVALAAIKAKM